MSVQIDPNLITAVFTAVTAAGALWAALEAHKTVRRSQDTIEAQLLNDFLREYSSHEMLESLLALRHWKATYKDDFRGKFEQQYRNGDQRSQDLNKARRMVSHYFKRALQLYEGKYVSKHFVETICRDDAVGILFEIVEPLEEIVAHVDVGQPYDKPKFDAIRRIWGN